MKDTLGGAYLRTAPMLLSCFPRQPMPCKIVGPSDENWAACLVTRKSSGCTHLMLERHPTFAGTTTQAVISLSSRESKLYAAVLGACRTLGLKALMLELSFSVQTEVRTESTSFQGADFTTRSQACATHSLSSLVVATKNRTADNSNREARLMCKTRSVFWESKIRKVILACKSTSRAELEENT